MNKKSEQLFSALHDELADTTHFILVDDQANDSFNTAGGGSPIEVAKLLAQGLLDLLNRHEAWHKPLTILAILILNTISNNNERANEAMDIAKVQCSSTIH